MSAEMWDVLDGEGRATGRIHPRDLPLEPGDYHLVVHVWIVDSSGDFLIQRRALHLDRHPGVWATTGGSVLAGEDSRSAAIRESAEELGVDLSASELLLLDRLRGRAQLDDVWLAMLAAGRDTVVQPGPEVIDARWVSTGELTAMLVAGEFFRYSYVEDLLADPRRERLTPPG